MVITPPTSHTWIEKVGRCLKSTPLPTYSRAIVYIRLTETWTGIDSEKMNSVFYYKVLIGMRNLFTDEDPLYVLFGSRRTSRSLTSLKIFILVFCGTLRQFPYVLD